MGISTTIITSPVTSIKNALTRSVLSVLHLLFFSKGECERKENEREKEGMRGREIKREERKKGGEREGEQREREIKRARGEKER